MVYFENNVMTIETEKCILREFREEDWQEVHKYAKDSEVTRFMPWGPNNEEETKAFLGRVLTAYEKEPRSEYHFAVIDKASGSLAGACTLSVGSEGNGMLGYCYNKEFWGKGLGTEAAAALIEFGFARLGLHRIWAECDFENHGSRRIMEKNGMRKEACFIEKSHIKGEWRDDYQYALLRGHVAKLLNVKEYDLRVKNMDRFNSVFKYIETNYTQKITIHQCAQMLSITDSHFCHLFKLITGKALSSYINYLRLKKAETLLQNTNLSITEIALDTGFNDIAYFTRLFRKFKSITPSECRKENTVV